MNSWLSFGILILSLLAMPLSHGFQDLNSNSQALAPPDPDFSPKGTYEGPIDLPHIVRYRNLPLRMHLEPLIPGPVTTYQLNSRMIPLWQRALAEATDMEIQEVAAQSLARVADRQQADIQEAGPTLMSVAASTKNNRIRYLCAHALAAGNIQSAAAELIKLAAEGTDSQRVLIEPALARWKTTTATELWKPRLMDPYVTTASYRLAAEGLAELNDSSSITLLLPVTVDRSAEYSKRTAAAKAVAVLDPRQAHETAEMLVTGDIPERLLGLTLLDNGLPESTEKLTAFCDDSSDAVASVAWQRAFKRQPDVLLKSLPTGHQHRDSAIRMTAARVIRLYPDPDRILMLNGQLSDIHIEVRNVARQMLLAVANEHGELKDQIISLASSLLVPDSPNWQGIEQSLVLLGQLHSAKFAAECFVLLDYPRDEVGVSAAWLIQLSPDESIREKVAAYVQQAEQQLTTGGSIQGEALLRESMLLQYVGLVRMNELRPLLEQQFPKSAPGTTDKRASALWALGLLLEKNPVPEIAAKFEARIKDRQSIPPEHPLVQRSSVMALGLMRASASKDVVFESYTIDSQESRVAGTARWVLPLLGEPMPPDFTPSVAFTGPWRLNPLDDNR